MSEGVRRVLVAGGTGFIGSAIVRRLRADGVDVAIATRGTGVDLTDERAVARLPRCDVIVHAACRASVPESWATPRSFYRDHFLVTLNLLEHARASGARLALASTYVYGTAPPVPVAEDAPVQPHSPYTASRLLSEQLCRDYHREHGVPIDVLRIFNAYGPGQRREFAVPAVVAGALAGRIELAGPEPRRDFVHVDDVARAFALVVGRTAPSFDVFNIGSGASRSLGEVAMMAARIAGRPVEFAYTGAQRAREVPDARADAAKAARVLGWRARIDFEDGLAALLRERATAP
jgi:nucleoside-diphosphate-sugar epimerase